jgi:hypothetical protein
MGVLALITPGYFARSNNDGFLGRAFVVVDAPGP